MNNTKEEEELSVPEEPGEEEEAADKHEEEQESRRSSIGSMKIMTAFRIARWMARAYGYVAKKRQTYLNNTADKVGSRFSDTELSVTPECSRSRRTSAASILDDTSSSGRKDVVASHLVGEENEDQQIVCKWFATSYGQVNQEYHEAYSREIFRQIRIQTTDPEGATKIAPWFG